jgi:uncharacterized protein (TIGR03086 family)
MEQGALLSRAVNEVNRLVDGISDDQLDAQTPCTDWKVRDLVNHLVGGANMFAVSAETGSVPDDVLAALGQDNLGDDFKQAWKQASTRATAAFNQPGIEDKTVALPFGEMPAPIAATIAVFDVTTHACDLATATGQQIQDTELLDIALQAGKQMIGPELRVPGFFGAEQPCADDASAVDRLLAFAGRVPQPTA